MGKYILVQTNRGITGEVLIEINNKTVTGLILPEIVYNGKKKLGFIFMENHNSEQLELERGQRIGLVTSCIVTQDEQGQLFKKRKEDTQSFTGRSNDMDTHIGSASGKNAEKAGQRSGSVQSIENRQFYKTEGEKRQFVNLFVKGFQLDMNAILNVAPPFYGRRPSEVSVLSLLGSPWISSSS